MNKYLSKLQHQHHILDQKIKASFSRLVDDIKINALKKKKLLLKDKIINLLPKNS